MALETKKMLFVSNVIGLKKVGLISSVIYLKCEKSLSYQNFLSASLGKWLTVRLSSWHPALLTYAQGYLHFIMLQFRVRRAMCFLKMPTLCSNCTICDLHKHTECLPALMKKKEIICLSQTHKHTTHALLFRVRHWLLSFSCYLE